jgi:hypothetical protein
MIKGKQKEVKTTEEKYLYRKKNVRKKWFVVVLWDLHAEPVFLKVYGALESIPRNEFRQPM